MSKGTSLVWLAGLGFFASLPGVLWYLGVSFELGARTAREGNIDAKLLLQVVGWWLGELSFAKVGTHVGSRRSLASLGALLWLAVLVGLSSALMLERYALFDQKHLVPLGFTVFPLFALYIFGFAITRLECVRSKSSVPTTT